MRTIHLANFLKSTEQVCAVRKARLFAKDRTEVAHLLLFFLLFVIFFLKFMLTTIRRVTEILLKKRKK